MNVGGEMLDADGTEAGFRGDYIILVCITNCIFGVAPFRLPLVSLPVTSLAVARHRRDEAFAKGVCAETGRDRWTALAAKVRHEQRMIAQANSVSLHCVANWKSRGYCP